MSEYDDIDEDTNESCLECGAELHFTISSELYWCPDCGSQYNYDPGNGMVPA